MSAKFDKSRATYLQKVLKPKRLTRICDVGANPIGPAPYEKLLQSGFCEVWGFEPQPEAYAQLVQNQVPNTHFLPYAIGPAGKATLQICANGGFTSLLEPNADTVNALGRMGRGTRVIERVEMTLHPLDGMKDLPPFDLLKIDIQGGEVGVYQSGKKRVGKALAVISEVAAIPIYHNQPLMDAQMSELRKLGFHFHKFMFLKPVHFLNEFSVRLPRREFHEQALDGDAVFIRKLLDLAALSPEELKHLVVLTDAVILSQDLAVTAMAELVRRGNLTSDQVHGYIDLLPHATERGDA
ncbi:MAG: FkbM family methyltransferase [Sulfitobacter sp.]|nr:FkbM family methyltransferase [Sulfitobacter sp.]